MFDIYFEDKYGSLYERGPDEVFDKFILKNEYGCITNKFIKRVIPKQIEESSELYYDIVTPYGYGGPIIESLRSQEEKNKLIESYETEFKKYARDNNIIAEFVRFHPIAKNSEDFDSVYEIRANRTTFGTDLSQEDPISYDFSPSARKKIRKILKKHRISYEYDEHPKDLSDFKKIYYSTMERKFATDEYYFDDKYFNNLIKFFPDNLVTVKIFLNHEDEDKLIGMGLYFKYGKLLHTHLSGTLTEFIKISPAYILKQALVEYGLDNGYELIHYGGGKTSAEDDSLKEFKQRFGQHTQFVFSTGTRIWNSKKYNEYCETTGNVEETDFFPAYRKSNKEHS